MRLWHRDGLAPYELEWFCLCRLQEPDEEHHTAVGWRQPSARTRPLAPPNARAATAATLLDKIFTADLPSRLCIGTFARRGWSLSWLGAATAIREIAPLGRAPMRCSIKISSRGQALVVGRLSHLGLICCSMCFAAAEDCFSSAVVPPTLKAATACSNSLSCRAAP